MNKFFNPDNFFWRWFGKLADICVLSILWILCCLPIITIIPSCISLYDAIAHCVRGDEDAPYKRFFRTLKSELLRGIGLTLLWGVFAAILWISYNYLYQMGKTSDFAAMYSNVYLGSMLIPIAILAWLIPIESRFSNSFWGLHKTAATFAFAHLPYTAAIVGMLAAAIALLFLLPVLAILLPGILVSLQSWLIEKVFKQYMPKEETAETSV